MSVHVNESGTDIAAIAVDNLGTGRNAPEDALDDSVLNDEDAVKRPVGDDYLSVCKCSRYHFSIL